ncbi:MAG: LysM peptidoglycan-binding domain-containing protein [Lachnospiraceae bacterium]|nr:LysM peptidoglycan-binding domain-containing protein [Lachnospiraceae bacterium]
MTTYNNTKNLTDHLIHTYYDQKENLRQRLHLFRYRFASFLSRKPKTVLYSGLALAVIAACILILWIPGAAVSASPDHTNNKYFTTIQIGTGDTLWDISKEYISPEYASMDDYIKEVEKINHISRDDITSGCYLVIPYYAESPIID